MPAIKRIFAVLTLMWVLLSLADSRVMALEMDLMQGEVRKGRITVLEREGTKFAALDEMLTSLGFAPTPATGGLVVTFSGKKVEFWSGSTVARINGAVFPLPNVVFSENGHWWGEANAALHAISQFLASAGRPHDLRWSSALEGTNAKTVVNVPVAPRTRQEDPPLIVTQPSAGGTAAISRVRWGEQLDAYRAVIDISQQVDVTIKEYPDRLEVSFPRTTSQTFRTSSPWSPLSVAAQQTGGNTVLIFRHAAASVKGFWVQDPPRYVLDFYFTKKTAGQIHTPSVAEPKDPPAISTVPERPVTPVAPVSPAGARKKTLIVVDAGHGGHDPGAVGNNLKEKDINLKAALELTASLKALGYDVKLTRADDRYLKLGERTEFANKNNADIFISLHCNALPKGKHASGVELYLMAESTDKDALNLAVIENRELSAGAQNAAEVNAAADKRTQLLLKILGDMQQNDKINESTALAEFLYDKMRGSGFSIRKVRQAPFFVLKGAGMPALLVEMGYITEASDARQLNSQAYRKKMMNSLAAGIAGYLKRGQ